MQTQERHELLDCCVPVLNYREKSEGYRSSYMQFKEEIVSKLKTVIKAASFVEALPQNDILKVYSSEEKKLLEKIQRTYDSVVVCMKLTEFSLMQTLYSQKVLHLIETEVYKYIVENRELCGFKPEYIYLLGNGEYAMVVEKSLVSHDMESFFHTLKQFQRTVQNRVLSVGNKRHYVSVLVSVVYDSDQPLQNARFGILKLLEEKKTFFISHNG